MNGEIVGRALVSQVYTTRFRIGGCGRKGCISPLTACPIPANARNRGCKPGTVDPAGADCYQCWYDQHYEMVPNGGTRIGPVHYFDDCQLVQKPRHQRDDARLTPMTADMIEALRLPSCRYCAARLARMEELASLPAVQSTDSQRASNPEAQGGQ